VIHIEHVALWTDDLERLTSFYATYFGAIRGERYVNAANGFSSYFLSFEKGSRLEIMCTTQIDTVSAPHGAQRLGLTHLAVGLGSEAAVDALTARLVADGFERMDGPRRTGDGYYESTVLDPDGNRIELTV
jgi:lactoylglutathione lyase